MNSLNNPLSVDTLMHLVTNAYIWSQMRPSPSWHRIIYDMDTHFKKKLHIINGITQSWLISNFISQWNYGVKCNNNEIFKMPKYINKYLEKLKISFSCLLDVFLFCMT